MPSSVAQDNTGESVKYSIKCLYIIRMCKCFGRYYYMIIVENWYCVTTNAKITYMFVLNFTYRILNKNQEAYRP